MHTSLAGVCAFVCACVYAYTCVYVQASKKYIYVCMYTYVCVCMYICVRMYVEIHETAVFFSIFFLVSLELSVALRHKKVELYLVF